MFQQGIAFIRAAMIQIAQPLFDFKLQFADYSFSLGGLFMAFIFISLLMSIFWRGGHK